LSGVGSSSPANLHGQSYGHALPRGHVSLCRVSSDADSFTLGAVDSPSTAGTFNHSLSLGLAPTAVSSRGDTLHAQLVQLPYHVKQDYPPLLKHFLKNPVFCALSGDASSTGHGSHDCAKLRQVYDFQCDGQRALDFGGTLKFENYSVYFHCFDAPWVCHNVLKRCYDQHTH
jgi:hypothetical protein